MKLDDFLKRSETTPPAVVVGGARGGLGVARDLGRHGVPVLGITPHRPRGLKSSRYTIAAPCADAEDQEERFIADLEAYGRRLPQRAVVFPLDEAYVNAVSRHRPRLEEHFIVTGLPWDRMQALIDKERQIDLAKRAGVDIPRTAFIHDQHDLQTGVEVTRYPCVLKPSLPSGLFQQLDLKAAFIHDREDLEQAYERFEEAGPMLLQEYVPGQDGDIYISGTSHDAQSRCLAMFTGRKLRQHPTRFGVTRLAESLWSPQVADLTLRLLGELRFRGVSDVEFKRDPRDGRYKFMEINARQGLWSPLSTAAGINLSYITYRDAIGNPCEVGPQRDGVRWIDLRHDVTDSYGEWRSGDLSLRDWLRPLPGVRADAWISLRDPLPIFRELVERTTDAARSRLSRA